MADGWADLLCTVIAVIVLLASLIALVRTHWGRQWPRRAMPPAAPLLYVSLTTSPQRLPHIPDVLAALDMTHVSAIVLNLPQRFARTGARMPPTLPSRLAAWPRLVVQRLSDDPGPLAKLAPTAVWASTQGRTDAVIVTVDDDIAYPRDALHELAAAIAVTDGRAVVGRRGQLAAVWGIDTARVQPWASTPNPGGPLLAALPPSATATALSLAPVDIVEGFAGIAYPVACLTTPVLHTMATWASSVAAVRPANACLLSDDYVISAALRAHHVPVLATRRQRFLPTVVPHMYGLLSDALSAEGNTHKYRVCAATVDAAIAADPI